MQLVKYAAAQTECLTANWNTGNGGPIGLGDMSEANGAIPGTSVGSPGHPEGTHTYGHDMDIAYYQINTPDNRLRSVCPHTIGNQEQYHCTGPAHLLDEWRTAVFIAKLHDTPQLRVIGVDGQGLGVIVQAVQQSRVREGIQPRLFSTGNPYRPDDPFRFGTSAGGTDYRGVFILLVA